MLHAIDIEDIKKIALDAGKAVMEIYNEDFSVEFKEDNSPLTKADLKANKIICEALAKLFPTTPIMSEENQQLSYQERQYWEYYWCIDPIDGTKEFVKKNGEFSVNIALVFKDTPVLGVVYAPATKELYWAKKGEGAFKDGKKLPLFTNDTPEKRVTVLRSGSHPSKETAEFIASLVSEEIVEVVQGSSLKLCMVAEGSGDIYPRLAPTSEWDTAAADAIVREAGKMSYIFGTNEPLRYNKESLLNPWFIVK